MTTVDIQGREKWVEFSKAKDEMFKHTDIKQAPWYDVEADDKRRARFGNTGLGASRISQELQQVVIAEIVKRAGLSRKSRGKMQVCLLGKDYEAVVEEYDSFGESAFTITLKERKKQADG